MPSLVIPPDKFDVYLRYKKGTREIVAWLMKFGSRKYKNAKTVTIKDLTRIVEVMCTKHITMPDTIHFLFRETISDRSQLSRFFRDQLAPDTEDPDTTNHEFFTTSLSKIYSDLCQCCNQPANKCRNAAAKPITHSRQTSNSNRYSILPEEVDKGHFVVPESAPSCHDCTKSASICTARNRIPRLTEDGLGDTFELSTVFHELYEVLEATDLIWEQAHKDNTPLSVTAFTTNATLSMFESLETRIRSIYGGSDPGTIEARLLKLFGQPRALSGCEQESELEIQNVDTLQSWAELLQMKDIFRSGNTKPSSIAGTPTQSPTRGEMEGEGHNNHIHLLESIAHYITQSPHPSAIIRHGTPLFADLGYFLTHDGPDVNGFRCTYGLQLFMKLYRHRLSATTSNTTIYTNSRLQALRFAQEILPSLVVILSDKSMPCRCYRTLAFHLEGLQNELKSFLQERNFGLFVQSPWVSGAHILEMLETTFYYGLRLLSYRNYVGSVFHMYNILRIYGDFEVIPVLEDLCQTFNEVIFPGGRPSRSFKACWVRFIGGRLRFDSHGSDHRTGNHHFVIPPHKAEATAGFGLRKEANDERFAYHRISLFHHIKEMGYHLDEDLWTQVYNDSSKGRRPCPLPQHQDSRRPSCHSQHRLLHLHSKALSEFSSSPLPAVKINYFDVYMRCVQILSLITDEIHEKSGDRCTCFLETLVLAADRFQNRTHRGEPFGYKGLLETCKKAVRQVLVGKNQEDFVWKNL